MHPTTFLCDLRPQKHVSLHALPQKRTSLHVIPQKHNLLQASLPAEAQLALDIDDAGSGRGEYRGYKRLRRLGCYISTVFLSAAPTPRRPSLQRTATAMRKSCSWRLVCGISHDKRRSRQVSTPPCTPPAPRYRHAIAHDAIGGRSRTPEFLASATPRLSVLSGNPSGRPSVLSDVTDDGYGKNRCNEERLCTIFCNGRRLWQVSIAINVIRYMGDAVGLP